jgi:lipid-binding SYLF domain-containing protein
MKPREIIVSAALCLAAPLAGAAEFSWDPLKDVESVLPEGVPNEGKIIQARHQVREMAQDALASLYEILPGARRAIERSAGYAVFSTFGVKLFFAGGTTGKGMVVNRRTGRQTFMKMAQVQGGLGFGVDKNRLIFVFANEQALRNFIDQGWEFGAQANVSAMAGGQGGMFTGAAAIAPGVYLYQLTDTGLSATLTVSGTKFFKDGDLN